MIVALKEVLISNSIKFFSFTKIKIDYSPKMMYY